MNRKFFTADEHFGHHNIIEYCGRPFKDKHYMDKILIENWNRVINLPTDEIFVIGDFSMSNDANYITLLVNRLNGIKHLVLGNHDRLKPFQYVEAGFQSVHTSLVVTINDGEEVILLHDPSAACNVNEKRRWLVGHIHNIFSETKNEQIVNVGVDVRAFTPVNENLLEVCLMCNHLMYYHGPVLENEKKLKCVKCNCLLEEKIETY